MHITVVHCVEKQIQGAQPQTWHKMSAMVIVLPRSPGICESVAAELL
jgi:hypothetical protein